MGWYPSIFTNMNIKIRIIMMMIIMMMMMIIITILCLQTASFSASLVCYTI